MAITNPEPGLVIRYAFLWKEEADKKQEEGKDRPCAVVLVVPKEGSPQRVIVVPITHSEPTSDTSAIEIPAITKKRLGLDQDRSWIITNQVNVFDWPGPDIRPVPTKSTDDPERFAYGYLGSKILKSVIDGLQEQIRLKKIATVNRDEKMPDHDR